MTDREPHCLLRRDQCVLLVVAHPPARGDADRAGDPEEERGPGHAVVDQHHVIVGDEPHHEAECGEHQVDHTRNAASAVVGEPVRADETGGVEVGGELVAHVVRFFPEYALAQAAVTEGQIGKPGVIRLHRGSYRPKKPAGNWFLDEVKSGGILMDLMIHDYDYARWVAGDVETVSARRVTQRHPEAPVDYGLVILGHRSGALSHIAGAWAYPPPTFRTHLEIAGDRGLIEFDSDSTAPIQNLILKTAGADAPDVALPSSPVSESPYTTQIKEFYRALAEGAPARVSAADGLAAVQIAEAALESCYTGQPVTLQPLMDAQ